MPNTVQSIKALAKIACGKLANLLSPDHRAGRVNIVAPGIHDDEWQEVKRRAEFYMPSAKGRIVRHEAFKPSLLLSPAPVLLYGLVLDDLPVWAKLHAGIFNVDHRKNPMDGWYWCEAATYVYGIQGAALAKPRLIQRILALRSLAESAKCYVFGTGPSLGKAAEREWHDGIRIVCNTIVRDKDLWRHIDPHLFVAGDAIYHFGFTEFACRFRADLRERMKESDVLFIYPDYFDFLVQREFAEFSDRLIPIPNGKQASIHNDFEDDFVLPPLGNVLNKLLLPVGCNISKHVCLWGFDGRAPGDQLFWSNSQKQSYTELLPTLQAAHPAFFDHFVPRENPEKYVQSVHGDVLEYLLSQAESQGWRFEMLHRSWTPTLAKRSAADVML